MPPGHIHAQGSTAADRRPHNLAKGVMKLSGILGGAVVLLPLTLVAQAQGVGDAQREAQVFAQCKVCHNLEAGKNLLSPSLHGLIGRKTGSVPGYAYSPAMKNANITWNNDTLSKYLVDPRHSFRATRWCSSASRTRASLRTSLPI